MKFNIKGPDYCTPLCPFVEIEKTITEGRRSMWAELYCQNRKMCPFIGTAAINKYKQDQEETECI